MNFLCLLFLTGFHPAFADSLYSHSEQRCAYAYAITSQWDLTLKAQGTFHLKYNYWDSRYKRKPAVDFIGSWEKRNDTLILSIAAPLQNDCYLTRFRFIQSKDTLKSLSADNICLPASLEPVKIFSSVYF